MISSMKALALAVNASVASGGMLGSYPPILR